MVDFPADARGDVRRLSEQVETAWQKANERFDRIAEQLEALRKEHERLLAGVAFIKSMRPKELMIP